MREAGEIAAARALFEWDAKHMDTECKTWDEIVAKGYDKGYRECARAMLDAFARATLGAPEEKPK